RWDWNTVPGHSSTAWATFMPSVATTSATKPSITGRTRPAPPRHLPEKRTRAKPGPARAIRSACGCWRGRSPSARRRPSAPLPQWPRGDLVSITRTGEELSIVCSEYAVPQDVRCEGGWQCLQVVGPIDFSAVGVLTSLVRPLSEAGISVFVLSTFDTDYLM